MKKRGAAYTEKGGRQYNEDCQGIWKKGELVCAAVADGLGGHGGGAQASLAAIECIKANFLKIDSLETVDLQSWFFEANDKVFAMQTPKCKMRTTLAVLCLDNHSAMWAHAGDTRLYHFINGSVGQVTFDHSVTQMAVLSGEISNEDMRGHVDRNKLLRALGKEEEVRAEQSAICDISEGEHAFLLCTDGFWEYVYEEEMEKLLAETDSPTDWLERMHEILAQRADGENDNNTAVAIWCK